MVQYPMCPSWQFIKVMWNQQRKYIKSTDLNTLKQSKVFKHDVMLNGLYFIMPLWLTLAELHNTRGSDTSRMQAWVPDAGNRVFSLDNWVPDDRSGGGWKHQTNAAEH